MNGPFLVEPRGSYWSLPPVVVDCSVLAAVLFHEAKRDEAAKLLAGRSLCAPWLIDHELINVALKKVREGLADVAERGLNDPARLSLTRCETNVLAQWELARRENLSAYDAAYLQLAIEMKAPLVTFDKKLASAAARVLGDR